VISPRRIGSRRRLVKTMDASQTHCGVWRKRVGRR
jgi:hypothetical protein